MADQNNVLNMHILRNPYGYTEDDVRRARLWAGERIEELLELLNDAERIARRVVDKVEGTASDGRQMRSSETYTACKAFLADLAHAKDARL